MSLLLTPTLFNSIDWYHNAPPSWKKKAYTDLKNMLNRVWTTNKAVERGMAYEKKLYYDRNIINDISENLKEDFNKAYAMIHQEGADFQHKIKKFVTYDKKEFVLYGKTDVYTDHRIYDIKTTGNWKGPQKYLDTWQHKVYCWATDIQYFTYIIYIFNNYDMLIDIKFVNYKVKDFDALDKEIKKKVASVVEFLRSNAELKKAYVNKFNLYN